MAVCSSVLAWRIPWTEKPGLWRGWDVHVSFINKMIVLAKKKKTAICCATESYYPPVKKPWLPPLLLLGSQNPLGLFQGLALVMYLHLHNSLLPNFYSWPVIKVSDPIYKIQRFACWTYNTPLPLLKFKTKWELITMLGGCRHCLYD